MAKEKGFNPVAAQRKADKARDIKKGKATVQAQRNERLARRNPERLQRQIDELKEAEASGSLRPRDRENLSQLEKELKSIVKAREALGDKAPKFGRRDGGDREGGGWRHDDREDGARGGVLGKRRRGGSRIDEDESETDEDVRDIPMPHDTPPPIPRRQRKYDNPNDIPLGESSDGKRGPHALPSKPVAAAPVQTVYSAAPQIRDLKKEATSRFVPAAVQKKLGAIKGQGKLLEPEELEKLEKEGYGDAEEVVDATLEEAQHGMMEAVANRDVEDILQDEEEQFERELRKVEIEDVTDEEDL